MEDTKVSLPNGGGVLVESQENGNSSTKHQLERNPEDSEPAMDNQKLNTDMDENHNRDDPLDVAKQDDLTQSVKADGGQAKTKQITNHASKPQETKSSQLRNRTRSDPALPLAQKFGFKRQVNLEVVANNHKPEPAQGKTTKIRRSLSQSTASSDENSERDLTEVASSKGATPISDFKSKEQLISNKASAASTAQGSAAARQGFAESHHLFGLSGPAKKTPPPSTNRLKTQQANHSDSTQPYPAPHQCPQPPLSADKYLTPLQQKDRQLRESNSHILKLQKVIQEQTERIQHFEEEKERDLEKLRNQKNEEIELLLDQIKSLEQDIVQRERTINERQELLESEERTSASLKQQIEDMKKELEDKEAVHQQRYLDMYQKGREAQLIDQEEDLMCSAIATAPTKDAPTRHLVKSLEKKEQELEKLRQTFREDVYHKSPLLDTDSAAQVEILKSAVYYYLTDKQSDINLSVMLSMLSYSPTQKANIISHLKKKKPK
ncbi:leucine-rich repeat and coiled-coil domain-containing protein 1-like [Asterias rubens]|uniref:leucine-rich repeat and coiled-coil domain-containing protein 1-like n=1 Tax=Asterias rubens TaxID=7604 RepID=UPI001455CAF2|nr:leucine-rich repeat and coiled-coil domain-containing protein 1-like [Asterias rubens]XP_033640694.1 leucine-rich repeat and coiled-coil domain-containing protein 1-like [Asterias rubens]